MELYKKITRTYATITLAINVLILLIILWIYLFSAAPTSYASYKDYLLIFETFSMALLMMLLKDPYFKAAVFCFIILFLGLVRFADNASIIIISSSAFWLINIVQAYLLWKRPDLPLFERPKQYEPSKE